MTKYHHPRIQLFVILPPTGTSRTKSVRILITIMYTYRQVILNNSTLLNEQDISKAMYKRRCDYNKKHAGKTIIIILQKDTIPMLI